MNAIKRRIQELVQYAPPRTAEAAELDRFWDNVLMNFDHKPLNGSMNPYKSPLNGVDVYHVTYEGFDETPVHGWYLVPSFLNLDQYPCIVIYQGYTADRGLPERYASWLLLGYAVFAVDTRGQGGDTGNRLYSAHGTTKGWITQNITQKEQSYYMAAAIDAVKAVDWVSSRAEINPYKIAVMGGSQGGGLALLASALNTKVSLVIADIPNMCHLDFGVMHSVGSLAEVAEYVKRRPDQFDLVMHNLAFFDVMNLAYRIHCPVRMSVGLKDTVCWPESIFAAYNQIQAEKHLDVHPFSGHEVGEPQLRMHMEYLQQWKLRD
ncbi:alpha/beta fold hydrolase [Paenibacillus sediminis]|uniref:Cephalosporin-C deacetylase n=1 Tax=Paenibacillus sediminis TaxID=664909 RepID=A0ABS4H2Q4_9BACL|nr:alpha/beta fold hydrolase [Paenibacillus sediminis]MBP1936810.1 cephalosporin-C deacetylase [Paenibacillus sediminis]